MKGYILLLTGLLLVNIGFGQTTKPVKPVQPAKPLISVPADTVKIDTVIIQVGKSSILFIIRDKKDLEKIKGYDLNKIVEDLNVKLNPDSTSIVTVEANTLPEPDQDVVAENSTEAESEDDSEQFSDHDDHSRPKGIRHYFNMDLGMNNYLTPNGFPDESNELYTVRPWGSWMIGFNSVNEAYISNSVSLQFGAGISWYNFKFQEDDVYILRTDDGIEFVENPDMLDASFKKSKLTVAYLNLSLVPVFHFGNKRYHGSWKVWDHGPQSGFRLGFGGYAGYRIGSYTKVKYNDDNNEKRKDHDSFYLENFRYGLRLQLGFRDTDLFFSYDLNDLFREGKGPELNAFSFGIIF